MKKWVAVLANPSSMKLTESMKLETIPVTLCVNLPPNIFYLSLMTAELSLVTDDLS